MAHDYARSISDDYHSYVDDELGYDYRAWEVIPASESRRHERIRLADDEELDALRADLADLSDVERWAMARRFLRRGDHETYFEMVAPILDGELAHPALQYPEIFADVARRHAEREDLEAADGVVEKIVDRWPEFSDAVDLLRAKLRLRAGEFESADETFSSTLEDTQDVDILFETARDFADVGAVELALRWLERAKQTAESIGDTASLVDIKLLSAGLTEGQTTSESPLDRP